MRCTDRERERERERKKSVASWPAPVNLLIDPPPADGAATTTLSFAGSISKLGKKKGNRKEKEKERERVNGFNGPTDNGAPAKVMRSPNSRPLPSLVGTINNETEVKERLVPYDNRRTISTAPTIRPDGNNIELDAGGQHLITPARPRKTLY